MAEKQRFNLKFRIENGELIKSRESRVSGRESNRSDDIEKQEFGMKLDFGKIRTFCGIRSLKYRL